MCIPGRDDTLILKWRPLAEGVERVDGWRLKSGYAPHSHDSYVVGLTFEGEQRFRYRRARCASHPGEAYVLHPGETHDGYPGTRLGYSYGALYVAPALIGEAAGGGALPFLPEAVSRVPELGAVLARGLAVDTEAEGDLGVTEFVADLAAALARLSGRAPRPSPAPHAVAMKRIAEELRAGVAPGGGAPPPMGALEAEHGLSRFAIARQFRKHFGVSPSRYVVLRRLDLVRAGILNGEGLASAALAAGFSDQSHMTRHFVRAYGLSPGRWRSAIASSCDTQNISQVTL